MKLVISYLYLVTKIDVACVNSMLNTFIFKNWALQTDSKT
jgi:hypothetical protein